MKCTVNNRFGIALVKCKVAVDFYFIMGKQTSVILDRFHSEVGIGKKSVYRHSQNLLRKLVLNNNRICREMRTFSTNIGKVSYEAGTGLIFNLTPQNKRLECYNAYNWRKNILPVYSIPITSCYVVSVWQQNTCKAHINKGHRASIFMLLKNGFLQRTDMQLGVTLEEVYLPPNYKFVEMIEDRETGFLYLKSTHAGISNADIIAAIIIFSFPHLEFVAYFEVKKSIFGKTANNVEVSQGLLLVLHSNNIVKLYSLHSILSKFTVSSFKLGEVIDGENTSSCCVGKYPYGLPMNVFITETPCPLLELRSIRNSLQIGGQPWHCIISPSKGKFLICRLDDLKRIDGGTLYESDELEDDLVVFHPDESLKIVHVTSSNLEIYRVVNGSNSKLENFFSLRAFEPQNLENEQQPRISSFGRRICRPKFYVSHSSSMVFDYEDELDIFAIMIVRDFEDGKGSQLEVVLQDSTYGKILRTISLPDCSWPTLLESRYSFEIDGPLIVVNVKWNNTRKMILFMLSENEYFF